MTYLQPTGPQPIYGKDLNRFIHDWLAGVIDATNLTPDMIRPYDQSEPPAVPNKGEAWMAFRQTVEEADTYPVVKQVSNGATLQRHETLRVLCSFYDTGTNGQAARLAGLLRDSGMIPDNLEGLYPIVMVGFEKPTVVPSLLSEQWLYRVDLPFRLRRQIDRTYGVPNIEIVDGVLHNDIGLPDVTLHVEEI